MIRRSKYNARRTTVDGITFASQREAARYQELRLLEKAGKIADLEVQPVFPLHVPAMHRMPNAAREWITTGVGTYRADFAYVDLRTGTRVIEDAKGVRTPVYRLKKRMVEAQYGIEVQEV